jgi:CRP-like cAMP-binding protein
MLLHFDRTPGLYNIAAYKSESTVWLLPAETYFKVRAFIALPESQSDWSAPTFNWVRAHECSDQQFLNVRSADPNAWACESCPIGAACLGSTVWNDVRAQKGWWRVPWSNEPSLFKKCPYVNDCLGWEEGAEQVAADKAGLNGSTLTEITSTFHVRDVHEGCVNGTSGVLCNACIPGFNRDGVTCMQCQAESFGLRIGVFVIGSILAGMLLYVFRSRLKRRWRRLKPLWRDALRVLSINVTFAQINCSLPSVIDVNWPPNFIAFVANFNIVNIDLMSLLGTNCISGFSFYASFIFMTLIPVGVAIVGLAEYCASSKLMVRRLQLMTAERKQKKEEEALHLLFKIADADNSGQIDTGELMVILQQLGWKGLDLDVVLRCALQTGAKLNQFGIYTMTERSFVAAMVDGELRNALMEQNKDDKIGTLKETAKQVDRKAGTLKETAKQVDRKEEGSDTDKLKLVRWTLTRQTMSNSLSGATQLLLLAHTPVSRKVFQYFHCNDMSGRMYLRADYRVLCYSNAWWSFLPVVLVVLIFFSVALPGLISYYLWKHRKELYSTSINQTMGWLYEPFARGAEFWMVHDVLMKMVLTGMLIYLPNMVRSSVAIILCLFAIANLNFFRPHKSKVLFWLTQLSFLTMAIKYIATLMLSANIPREEVEAVGITLIVLDIMFMVASVVAIFMAFWLLREKMIILREKRRERQRAKGDVDLKAFDYIDSLWFADDDDDEILEEMDLVGNQNYDEEDRAWRLRNTKTKTLPLKTRPEKGLTETVTSGAAKNDEANGEIRRNDGTSGSNGGHKENIIRSTTMTEQDKEEEYGEHVITVEKLMNSYAEHENGLRRVTSQRQQRQKRHTQMRVRARARIRSTNALRNVPLFQDLTEEKMKLLIDSMDYEKFAPGKTLVAEGEPASKFYIITTGNCIVSTKKTRGHLEADNDVKDKTAMAVGVGTTPTGPSLAGKLGLSFRDVQNLKPEEKDALWDKQHAMSAVTMSEVEIGRLAALDFFGESALLGRKEEHVRKATVRANLAAPVQVLSLSNMQFNELVAKGVLDAKLVSTVKAAADRRAVVTFSKVASEAGSIHPPPASEIDPNETQTAALTSAESVKSSAATPAAKLEAHEVTDLVEYDRQRLSYSGQWL